MAGSLAGLAWGVQHGYLAHRCLPGRPDGRPPHRHDDLRRGPRRRNAGHPDLDRRGAQRHRAGDRHERRHRRGRHVDRGPRDPAAGRHVEQQSGGVLLPRRAASPMPSWPSSSAWCRQAALSRSPTRAPSRSPPARSPTSTTPRPPEPEGRLRPATAPAPGRVGACLGWRGPTREGAPMSVLTEAYTLRNGTQIPQVGFGTWLLEEGDECHDAVADALRLGYRHIDTARAYGNEASVGRAVRDSGIPRGEPLHHLEAAGAGEGLTTERSRSWRSPWTRSAWTTSTCTSSMRRGRGTRSARTAG